MASIVEFLEARIAEDEASNRGTAEMDDDDRGGWAILYAQRVLAECAAKRAVIEHAQKASEAEEEFDDYMWRGAGPKREEPWSGDAILFALASVYNDHPGYRQEWARG
ncbi:hypothetical protein SEA_ABBYDAISY_37 [Arthrobacter phage AbbyDaisy]|nr:hypothetical protein SEA_ABBYDAISY_37 [Arthrobacter phage AbbyDaisy]